MDFWVQSIDVILIILGSICVFVGIIGCFLPIIPGPPISYFALLLVHWTEKAQLGSTTLLIWAVVTLAVTALDYVVPIWGTKKFGGTKRGAWGSTLGLVVGFFFAPFGIILGPLIGAFLGEMTASPDTQKAMRSAFGSFLGFLAGTLFKIIASGWMGYLFFSYAFGW